MAGIVHKESLPGQGHIKRRRVDVPTPAVLAEKRTGVDVETSVPLQETNNDGNDKKESLTQESANQQTHSKAPASSTPSSGSSSSDEDEDDSDNEIERENARLAKLREQRSRRQEQPSSGGEHTTTSHSAITKGASSANAVGGANSYDHDVLFRNAAWRSSSKPSSAQEKQKEKWNAVLNRTQDSPAHRHFMKKFFK